MRRAGLLAGWFATAASWRDTGRARLLPNRVLQDTRRFGRSLTLPMVAALVAAALLLGCAPAAVREATSGAPDLPVSSTEGLPEYAYRSAQALRGYQIAVAERELLARLPCYCGCGQDPQFRSLRDCFLDDQGGFRSHGANCQVCLEEAEDAARWKAQGLSTREIREKIDSSYGGRGEPTDTPPVLE